MVKSIHMNELNSNQLKKLAKSNQLIDVRTKEEFELNHIDGAVLHPVENINSFIGDKNKTYYVYCKSGRRSLNAAKKLEEKGYDIVNLEGGILAKPTKKKQLNYSGLQCPGPIVNISQEVNRLNTGDEIEVTVTDPGFYSDVKAWADQTGHSLISLEQNDNKVIAVIRKEKERDMDVTTTKNGTTIVLFSGELDKALAAFIIANGARAAGRDVTIFFTFWGLSAVKKDDEVNVKKSGIEKAFDLMLPSNAVNMPLSKMNMFGLGNLMMRFVMKQKNVDSIVKLRQQAIDQDIRLIACAMSMDVMGIKQEELIDEVEIGGVGTYIGDTAKAEHNLFI
ncbi:MAG TPA: DsrE/DsrF/DrsH-like family protein [Candidatus Nosocomiicoccus stercorigallinarum]|nr:DsrE/DsrF/DrsH-like family protein [Candidatus Nosocomiicoccus stercorigallinarum]